MPPKTRFGEALRNYREDASLSQDSLARLSFRLADEGLTKGGIHRQHISRLEGGQVPTPDPRTMHILATALAVGLRDAGYEDVEQDSIYKHLYNATRTKITSRDVSIEAADLDAILAPLNDTARHDIYESFKASARVFVERFTKRQLERERQRPRNE